MKKIATTIFTLLIAFTVITGQTQKATTTDGKKVILNADGTWKFENNGLSETEKDNLFLPYKMGMSLNEFETIFYPGEKPPLWENMQIAHEYDHLGIEVRYLWKTIDKVSLSSKLTSSINSCKDGGSYVCFLFKDKRLFDISIRLFENCNRDIVAQNAIQLFSAVSSGNGIYKASTASGVIRVFKAANGSTYGIEYLDKQAPRPKDANW